MTPLDECKAALAAAKAEIERLQTRVEAGCAERGYQYEKNGALLSERDHLRDLLRECRGAVNVMVRGDDIITHDSWEALLSRIDAALGVGGEG